MCKWIRKFNNNFSVKSWIYPKSSFEFRYISRTMEALATLGSTFRLHHCSFRNSPKVVSIFPVTYNECMLTWLQHKTNLTILVLPIIRKIIPFLKKLIRKMRKLSWAQFEQYYQDILYHINLVLLFKQKREIRYPGFCLS